MAVIQIKSNKRAEMIDITSKVAELIPSDFGHGVCRVFCMHTTAGLTINENADPSVRHDILAFLEKLIPWDQSLFTHLEGNSAAHIKASLLGLSQVIPIEGGRLVLGTWQALYFCEFDGPRQRSVHVQLTKNFH